MIRKMLPVTIAVLLLTSGALVLYYAFQAGNEVTQEAGEITDVKLIGDFEKKWSVDKYDSIYSLAAEGNNIFSTGQTVSAIDSDSGTTLWERGPAAKTPLTVGEGLLVYGGVDGNLYAFDSETGAEKWHVATGDSAVAPAIDSGAVYATANKGSIYALDAATGKEKWQTAAPGQVSFLLASGNTVSILAMEKDHQSHSVHTMDATTGNRKWAFPLSRQIFATMAIDSTTVYIIGSEFGAEKATLTAVDAATGAGKWEITGDLFPQLLQLWEGTLYVGSNNPKARTLRGIDPETGHDKWICSLDDNTGSFTGLAGVRNGMVFFSSFSELDGADAETGELKWRARIGGPVTSNPIIAGDAICFTYGNGMTLYALKLPAR